MPFKISDLMINDLSKPPIPIPARTCNPITRAICFNTNPAAPICPCQCTYAGDAAYDVGDPAESLPTLKEQLRRQLAEVERQQAALETDLLPESVEEVDDLVKKLTYALEVLGDLRARLAGE
jgi:hypothetical protein